MSPTSPAGDDSDAESDKQADAMKDQLSKDVASWSAARSGDTRDEATKHVTTRAPRRKVKSAQADAPVSPEKKPFKMSYDGMTDRDFMAHRLKLGAR
jgi:hypothetical protein